LNHSVELQPVAATLAFEANFSQHWASLETPALEHECVGQLADTVDSADSATKIFL
jgi:hypothetical protein